MSNNSLISVIIPNYNYRDYIVEALESVATQSYENWECIIVDDGSTDDSRKVITDFVNQRCDKRFKPFFIKNSGTSAAKNHGLKMAKGEFIQFLDADDVIEPNKFESQLKTMSEKNSDLVFSESTFFSMLDGNKVFFVKFPNGYLANTSLMGYSLLEKIVTNNVFTISSPLFKKNIVPTGGFITDLKNNEDWLFWAKIAFSNPLFCYDNSNLTQTIIRHHDKSAMQNNTKMFLGEVIVRTEIEQLIRNAQCIEETQKQSLIYLNQKLLSYHHIRSVDLKKGLSLLVKCAAQKPFHAPALFMSFSIKFLKRLVK